MSAQTAPLSFEELLKMEEQSEVRHEYIGGRLYAMAGGIPAHADISHNLQKSIGNRLRGNRLRGNRLRGKPCRGTSNDQRVRTSQTATNWYYPDFLIKCPPYRFHPVDKNALLNPHAISEFLSPATETFDRTAKFDEYKLIEELTDYILVDANRVRVEHFSRLENGDWVLRVYIGLEMELRLEHFEISMPLAEIYEDVEFGEMDVLPDLSDGE